MWFDVRIFSLLCPHLALEANWFDSLTVKQWEIMINNDVLLFSTTMRKHLTSSSYITERLSLYDAEYNIKTNTLQFKAFNQAFINIRFK